MREVLLAPRARADLAGIWDHTDRTWGRAQADRYLRGLDGLFQRLAEGRAASRSAEDLRPGYRKVAYERHVVFFRETMAAVEVVRVLHQRMDAGSRL